MLYVALSVSLISLAVMVLGLWLMNKNQKTVLELFRTQWSLIQNQNNRAQDELRDQLRESRKIAADLLNRMMAKDLPAYSAMTWQQFAQNDGRASASDPYISRSDESEAALLANSAGYGMPVYDEDTELFETIQEMTGHVPGKEA